MMEYLLFRLYGPLAAWGGIAVGQERPTDNHPTKSAVLGLLAAALGIRREEEGCLATLSDNYGFAVQVDAQGILLRDFHTAEVPSRTSLKNRPHYTRRDELMAVSDGDNPVLSYREYRFDSLYTIALWLRSAEVSYSLENLVAALECPRFVLYLGRKSCPLALPVQAQTVRATNLASAFAQAQFEDGLVFELLQGAGRTSLHWDEDADETGLQALLTVTRRDRLLSRRRWQFAERQERRGQRAHDQGEEGG